MKRFVLLLLAIFPLLSMAHDFEVNGIYYTVKSPKKLTVSVSWKGQYTDSYSNEYSGDLIIPECVIYDGKQYSVTSIGYYAFFKCTGLTSVTIPNSVTDIENGAFYECSGLTSVTIPNSVTTIGASAFRYCPGLTTVTIGNSVTSIGNKAFEGCSGKLIVNCNIPDAIYYKDGAFCDTKFSEVVIGDNVETIGSYAFFRCSELTTLTIGNKVSIIGKEAFYGCIGLTSLTIPDNVINVREPLVSN